MIKWGIKHHYCGAKVGCLFSTIVGIKAKVYPTTMQGKFLHKRRKSVSYKQWSENLISSIDHLYIDANNYNINKAVRIM